MSLDHLKAAVVTVGDGRGFVVDAGSHSVGRIIITAAHCLPHLPPCIAASYTEERTYANLVGPIGAEPHVWAQCVFADPVSDIAVLAGPDNQSLFEEADAWEAFIESVPVLDVVTLPDTPVWDDGGPREGGYMLSLDREWVPCLVRPNRGAFVYDAQIKCGMSGSPVLVNGRAFAVIGIASDDQDGQWVRRGEGPQARLDHHLPGWLWRDLVAHQQAELLALKGGQQ